MAFEDYKDIDFSNEETTAEEIKQLEEKYGVEVCSKRYDLKQTKKSSQK